MPALGAGDSGGETGERIVAARSVTRASTLAATQGEHFTAKHAEGACYRAPHPAYHVQAKNFEPAGHSVYRLPTMPLSDHHDLSRIALWTRGHDDHDRLSRSSVPVPWRRPCYCFHI